MSRWDDMPDWAIAAWRLGGLAGLAGVMDQIPLGPYACPGAPGCGILCGVCNGRRVVRVAVLQPEGARAILPGPTYEQAVRARAR